MDHTPLDQDEVHCALERCAAQCSQRAWRLASLLLRDPEDAADAVQQAFLVVARKPHALPADDPWPWFATVVGHEARNMRRRRHAGSGESDQIEHMADGRAEGVSERCERVEEQVRLKVALAELDEDEREAVLLVHAAGVPYRQASELLGVPLGTVSSRVTRGLGRLREKLEDHDEKETGRRLTLLAVMPPAGGMAAMSRVWVATAKHAVMAGGVTAGGVTAGGVTAGGVTAGGVGIGAAGVVAMKVKIAVVLAAVVVLALGAWMVFSEGERSTADDLFVSDAGKVLRDPSNRDGTKSGSGAGLPAGLHADAAAYKAMPDEQPAQQPSQEAAPNTKAPTQAQAHENPGQTPVTPAEPPAPSSGKDDQVTADDTDRTDPHQRAVFGDKVPWQASANVSDLVVSPDDRFFITASTAGIEKWDAETGVVTRRLLKFRTDEGALARLAMHPQGAFFASGGRNLPITIRSVETGERLLLLADSKGAVRMRFSADGTVLAAMIEGPRGIGQYMGHRVMAWTVGTWKPISAFDVTCAPLEFGLSADGREVFTFVNGYEEMPEANQISVWNVSSGALLRRMPISTQAYREGAAISKLWLQGGVEFSNDGTRALLLVLVSFRSPGTTSDQNEGLKVLQVIDTGTGGLLAEVATTTDTVYLGDQALSSHGDMLASPMMAAGAFVLRIADARNFSVIQDVADATAFNISVLLFSPSGQWVYGYSGTTQVFRANVSSGLSNSSAETVANHDTPIHRLAISPDATEVVSGDESGNVIAWDMQAGTLRGKVTGTHVRRGIVMDWSEHDVIGVPIDHIQGPARYNLDTGKRRLEYQPLPRTTGTAEDMLLVHAIVAMPEMHRLACVANEYDTNNNRAIWKVHLWDFTTGTIIESVALDNSVMGESSSVSCCIAHGNTLLFATYQGRLILCDIAMGTSRFINLDSSSTRSMAVVPGTGELMTMGILAPMLQAWDMEKLTRTRRISVEISSVLENPPRTGAARLSCFALTPDGSKVFVGSPDTAPYHCLLVEVATGKVLRKFRGHTEQVTSCAISADGKRAVSGSFDKTVRVWNLEGPYEE